MFSNIALNNQGLCRLWNISILAVIFLSIYNILLTVKLMYSPECAVTKVNTEPPPVAKPVALKCEALKSAPVPNVGNNFTLDLRLGRWDNSLRYKLFDRIIIGTRFSILSDLYTTCLATQGSIERLSSLSEVINHWTGPVSMATFAAGDDELNLLLLYILYLRKCNAKIRDQVNFHMSFPKNHAPKNINIDYERLALLDCSDPGSVFQAIMKDFKKLGKWRAKLPFPQNHLRNLARKNCQSLYVFLTDVDVIPSRGMAKQLNKFLETVTCRGRCAYVIPTYEVDDRVRFPLNKTELVRLSRKGLARPFHHKVFIYNQYATNFTRWQNVSDDGSDIHISHPVTNFEFLYEPFYVASDSVPPHDERFIGYGYTRNSQVYEMYVAGYEFFVLSPLFTCHWGLQIKRTRPAWRELQNNMNRRLFDGFKKEIFARYNQDPLNMISQRKKT